MKVVFNGVLEHNKKGCSACGKARSESKFSTSKTYIMPSGAKKTFYMGKPEDVSDRDGQFLLSYIEHSPNGTRKVFEEVK